MTNTVMHSIFTAVCAMTIGFSSLAGLTAQEIDPIFITPPKERSTLKSLEPKDSGRGAFYIGWNDEQYLDRITPAAYYFIDSTSYTGDVVRLHDSSEWLVNNNLHWFDSLSDRHIILTWLSTDRIFIKPNLSWISSYPYVLENRTTGETVEVDLMIPPLSGGLYTRFIVAINHDSRQVQLNDGSIWNISFKESYFYKWKLGHRLLIGVSPEWRTAYYPHVLINSALYGNPYCEADIL